MAMFNSYVSLPEGILRISVGYVILFIWRELHVGI